MIQIDRQTQEKIDRATLINVRFLDSDNTELPEEYQSLQSDLVQEFAPLISMLAKTGILNICVQGGNEYVPDYQWASCQAEKIFLNNDGKLWIIGGEQIPTHCGKPINEEV